MDSGSLIKVIVSGILWYVCHKFIRKMLNPTRKEWSDNDETDARLGGLAAMTKTVLKDMIL